MTVKHIPTISQYADAVGHPHGLFRTLGEPECDRNAYGEPIFSAGGNAAVFKVHIEGKPYALKCYIRTGKRTARIYDYIAAHPSPILCPACYLAGEIYVYDIAGRGEWRDAVLSEWVEGASLGYHIRRAMHYRDHSALASLAEMFGAMTLAVLSAEWGHGDIKPDNIIVTPDGTMKLLDYDAMFLPGFTGMQAVETGTPCYNHPARDSRLFNKHMDDYPLALIWAALRSLSYDTVPPFTGADDEICLFSPQNSPHGKNSIYTDAMEAAARRGDAITYRLLSLLGYPTPAMPDLYDIAHFAVHGQHSVTARPEPFTRNGAWGYTAAGQEIIPPVFDGALEFSEGVAVVELGRYRHFIDATGRTVINCSEYDHVKPFRNGTASVRRNGEWCAMDHNGNTTKK